MHALAFSVSAECRRERTRDRPGEVRICVVTFAGAVIITRTHSGRQAGAQTTFLLDRKRGSWRNERNDAVFGCIFEGHFAAVGCLSLRLRCCSAQYKRTQTDRQRDKLTNSDSTECIFSHIILSHRSSSSCCCIILNQL